MDYAVASCIEEEKQKCLDVIQDFYKKNNHPSVIRLRDYLQSVSSDPTVLEDLDRIKIYIANNITTDEATHAPFATDA